MRMRKRSGWHDLQREGRRLVHEVEERALVDHGDARLLGRDGGEAARRVVDDRELAERAVRPDRRDGVSPSRSSIAPDTTPNI